jgi:hypothetical protein
MPFVELDAGRPHNAAAELTYRHAGRINAEPDAPD